MLFRLIAKALTDTHVMIIIEARDVNHLGQLAASYVVEQLKVKPDTVLGLATGSTPLTMYRSLIAAYQKKQISFSKVKTFNLDEYVGLPEGSEQSYRYYMDQHFFHHVDIPYEHTFLPNVSGPLHAACRAYEGLLSAHPIDIQILGLGSNGHIGFNEPGVGFSQGVHVTHLTEQTRYDNRIYFSAFDDVPKRAITMGIQNIKSAKCILLLVNSEAKREALMELRSGVVDRLWPVTALQDHHNLIVIAVKQAL